MIVRRLLTGVLLAGLAAPLLAAAPHAREPRAPRETIPAPPPGVVTRVFARAEPADPSPAAAAASPAPAGDESPSPASSPSPEVAARARAVFEANRTGRIDRAGYTADMNARITDTALADAAASLKALGAVKSFTQVRKVTQAGQVLYVFRIECEKPPVIEEAIAWNAAGKIDFLQFGAAR
ncbi:MAG: hypothetical protein QOJ39_997 [Candidatus Eremiobacteraeota bacterium]|jgi:hypothetical protein|nr:hypothetical protein [Candidatus Eremiobacteraeota bacterium]